MSGKQDDIVTKRQEQFDQAMIDSADLLDGFIENIDFQISHDDFSVYELTRIVQNEDLSLTNNEFWFLVEQGIRLQVDLKVGVRAELVEALRHAMPQMNSAARETARDVISAIEDIEFPLYRIGAIVRSFSNQLFRALNELPSSPISENITGELLSQWKEGHLDRSFLFKKLGDLGSDAIYTAADLLFESPDDQLAVDAGIELLSTTNSKVSSGVLAYLVSEPILEETQELNASRALAKAWPKPLPYMLYNLKKHSHEDLPFRWYELLVMKDYTRAADRILEEVLVHSANDSYRPDLLSILAILDKSKDPGIVGKVLRLISDPRTPKNTFQILREWFSDSRMSEEIEGGLAHLSEGKQVLVGKTEDFTAFAAQQPGRNLKDLKQNWNDAYHEALGWQQRGTFPRGPIETLLEKELQDTLENNFSTWSTLSAAELSFQIESFRENWLRTSRDGVIPLVTIYKERSKETPWTEEIYWLEINQLYINASQSFDQGSHGKAREYLDIILQIEPDYPLAHVLEKIISN